MSIRGRATFSSRLKFTMRPLTRQKLRPVLRSSRPKIRVSGSSPSNPSFSRMGSMPDRRPLDSWKMPSILARRLPVRIKLVSARPPKSMVTASTIIDFPAPVSPVKTLKPDVNFKFNCSMMAKSMILSSVSIFKVTPQDWSLVICHLSFEKALPLS